MEFWSWIAHPRAGNQCSVSLVVRGSHVALAQEVSWDAAPSERDTSAGVIMCQAFEKYGENRVYKGNEII